LEWINNIITIKQICIDTNIDPPILDDDLNLNNIRNIKKELLNIYNTIYKITRIAENKIQEEKIKYHIEQRCQNYDTNPTKMINSILNRYKKKIVIDHLFTKEDNEFNLVLDEKIIKEKVSDHFQNVAISKECSNPISGR